MIDQMSVMITSRGLVNCQGRRLFDLKPSSFFLTTDNKTNRFLMTRCELLKFRFPVWIINHCRWWKKFSADQSCIKGEESKSAMHKTTIEDSINIQAARNNIDDAHEKSIYSWPDFLRRRFVIGRECDSFCHIDSNWFRLEVSMTSIKDEDLDALI